MRFLRSHATSCNLVHDIGQWSTLVPGVFSCNLVQLGATVAAGGDAMGNPTIHLGGAAGLGTTVEEAEEAGPVIADAVTPNTTNTADGDGTNAEVGGGDSPCGGTNWGHC